MSGVLGRICEDKRRHVADLKQLRSRADLELAAAAASSPRGFRRALQQASSRGYGLVAEIKKASPSKGLIREDFDPPALARAYAAGGATCLSVLTDRPWFQGSDDFLVAARDAVALPVLRKDFILDPWQVVESRVLGADCILLILAALEQALAEELEAAAVELGMDVLLEVHDEAELERAARLASPLIGINNRNLRTMVTDLAVTRRLAPLLPPGRLVVCESGLATPDDLAIAARAGARCFLVGESLMREHDVETATRRLLAGPVVQ